MQRENSLFVYIRVVCKARRDGTRVGELIEASASVVVVVVLVKLRFVANIEPAAALCHKHSHRSDDPFNHARAV